MEAVVNAAEVLAAAPQPGAADDACPEEGSSCQAASIPAVQALLDPMEDLSRKLEDILKTYGTADNAVHQQSVDREKMEEEAGRVVPVPKETGEDTGRFKHMKVGVLQQKVVRVQRERDQLRSEHQRGVLARSQLEGLCRELQKHNKTLKTTLNEIQTQIAQYSGRNNKLSQENKNLADKLESLMHQYEQREEVRVGGGGGVRAQEGEGVFA
ncbi:hypothetical protein NHX12_026709 [Muraenolepis orangiensis]|uniref:Uncharacterized protein n=1 Tax=Muraenolepis orangiensis TaxID=630683 RepID=A0A9Q0IS47_9TELE|nr:hypothetical protein NHX12_026709 [Muraenolepis orangiensis]